MSKLVHKAVDERMSTSEPGNVVSGKIVVSCVACGTRFEYSDFGSKVCPNCGVESGASSWSPRSRV